MAYHHKSGAQKRKDKLVKDKNTTKGQILLENLGFSKKEPAQIVTDSVTSHDEENLAEGSSVTEHVTTTESSCVQDTCAALCSTGKKKQSELSDPCASSFHVEQKPQEHQTKKKLYDFDIGMLDMETPRPEQVEEAVRRGAEMYPPSFPDDLSGKAFPVSILKTKMTNGEVVPRDCIAWSKKKQSLFCFPCRLFSKQPASARSSLTLPSGYSTNQKWKKLHDKIPEHQNSTSHKTCYVQWRNMEDHIFGQSTVDCLLLNDIKRQENYWKEILRRILDVTLFLGERGLAFSRGHSHTIGDPRNGNFLGILELLAHYDPLLAEHLKKVQNSQEESRRLQVHYLSPESQNEFIQCCAALVVKAILNERVNAKYFCIIVDATPDSAHVEQAVFVLRYVYFNSEINRYEVKERFLEFVDCNKKTGEAIAGMICETLEKHGVPLTDCRGQGYDNGSNMSGAYKGAQAHILKKCSLATFSPCACHSLNLCGVHAAESCPQVITFFGTIRKLYNLFSSSPQRWEILKKHIGSSLHSMSETRWSARVDSVRPFAAHLPALNKAVDDIMELNLTSETRADLNGIKAYLNSFECVVMASSWLKVLIAIDIRNKVLQARDATLDVEVGNIKSLLADLNHLRDNWNSILAESKLVGENLGMDCSVTFPQKRRKKRKLFADESREKTPEVTSEERFKTEVFYCLLDSVIANMTTRYEAAMQLEKTFGVLWKYPRLAEEDVRAGAQSLQTIYNVDVSEDLIVEIEHLKMIHESNLGPASLSPFVLLNRIHELKLDTLFPNVCIMLRIFCTLPVTVAQGERSFSVLARVKNVLR